ncbi:Hypothetical predicted protein, partial [Pelobates cultripes]
QGSCVADLDLPNYRWGDRAAIPPTSQPAPEIRDLIDWSWEDIQLAGGDGTKVSPPALQGRWSACPDL